MLDPLLTLILQCLFKLI